MKVKYFLTAAVLFLLGGFSFLAIPKIFTKTRIAAPPRPYNESIAVDSANLFQNDDDLYSYIKKFGPTKTVQHLNELVPQFGDCHQTAHQAGRFAYEIYNEKAFQLCSAECHSGCYHGATEAYFKEHGTANLTQSLNVICNSELNPFFSHQCLHGVGHGLMAWTNYALPDALKSCDLLTKGFDSCWTGVFMENIVGGLDEKDGHKTKYLNNDPQYPCTDVEDKYKGSCYFLQTSRMIQLFAGDFKKIGSECSKVPKLYQRTCFESMGRDVGGVFRANPLGAKEACTSAPAGTMRIGCLIGAAQDTFWDPTGQKDALNFCQMLTDKAEKKACYDVIFDRAPQVLTSTDDLKKFCANVESEYRDQCALRLPK